MTRRILSSSLAFVLGLVSLIAVLNGVNHEWRRGIPGPILVLIFIPALIAAALLLFRWRKSVARDPWSLVAMVFAGCAWACVAAISDRLGVAIAPTGHAATVFTFAVGIILYAMSILLMFAAAAFVFSGTRKFFELVRRAEQPR